MKHTLASIILLLTAGCVLAAQPRCGGGDRSFTLAAGHALHTGDPSGNIPYSSFAFGADSMTGAMLVGMTAELPGGERGTSAVEARFGCASKGSLRLAGFLTGRYLWEQDFSQLLVGYGLSADLQLAGPLGAFVSARMAYPVMSEYGHLWIPYRGQLILSYGLSLTF